MADTRSAEQAQRHEQRRWRAAPSPTKASRGCARASACPSRGPASRTTTSRTATPSATSPSASATTTRSGAIPSTRRRRCGAGSSPPPSLVGGDSLIGEDEVAAVADDQRDLMKGDPLRGVHAFFSASSREWWAPLRPDHRIWRRNALVAVLDKPSEFAERAVHEWSANVFRDDDGTLLSGQYRLMIRTERKKAREKKKYDNIELKTYTDDEITAIEEQYASQHRRGAEPRFWEDVEEGDDVGPMVKGPLTVTDMVCWHAGMGMGLYDVKPLDLGARNRRRVPRFYLRDDLQHPRRAAARALGSGVGAAGRQPHHLRLRPDARDLAHPPLHRVDGRRRLALEARVRVPRLQLRRRHAVVAGNGGAQVPGRRRPSGRRPRGAGREPAGDGHCARYRAPSCSRAASRARCGFPILPAARSDLERCAHRDQRELPRAVSEYDAVPGLEVALTDGVLELRIARPEKRNALDDTMMYALIDAVDAAGPRRSGTRDPAHLGG